MNTIEREHQKLSLLVAKKRNIVNEANSLL